MVSWLVLGIELDVAGIVGDVETSTAVVTQARVSDRHYHSLSNVLIVSKVAPQCCADGFVALVSQGDRPLVSILTTILEHDRALFLDRCHHANEVNSPRSILPISGQGIQLLQVSEPVGHVNLQLFFVGDLYNSRVLIEGDAVVVVAGRVPLVAQFDTPTAHGVGLSFLNDLVELVGGLVEHDSFDGVLASIDKVEFEQLALAFGVAVVPHAVFLQDSDFDQPVLSVAVEVVDRNVVVLELCFVLRFRLDANSVFDLLLAQVQALHLGHGLTDPLAAEAIAQIDVYLILVHCRDLEVVILVQVAVIHRLFVVDRVAYQAFEALHFDGEWILQDKDSKIEVSL